MLASYSFSHSSGELPSVQTMIQFIAPLFAIFIINSSPCKAQFPRVCAENVTAKTGVCCPSWGPGLVCGGPKRGMCLPLPDVHEIYSPARPDHMNDDRLNWPKAFFQKVCRCFGSRSGYACHECKFGYFGDDCTERRIQKRRNIMSLTRKEQQRFIGLVLKSKTSITDYVALKADWHDPVEGNVTFVNLTLHDFFVYIHYYSARHTYLRNKTHHCDNSRGHFDFSHEGSGFPTFHRLLILLWEREFQKLAEDDTFTFPYWDWVENGHHCEVCTNDLLGAVNLSDPNGHIDRRSPFSKWYTMCQTKRYNGSDCRFCNADDRFHGIVRRPVKDYRFPTLKEVDLILSKPNYDHRPYNEEAGEDTFRNCFEGGCPMPGQTYSIHNLVHAWFNGTLSGVTTSTNDPLFIVHHTMIDKLFERWMRMHKNHMTQMPEFGGPLGHHRDSVIVPMFPRFFHHMFFTDSRTLGYDYDNFDYGKHHRRDPEGYLEEEDLTSNTIVYFVTCLSFFVCLFLVMALYRENLKSTVSATYRILINRNGANNNGTLPNGNGSVKPYTDIPVKEYHDNAILQSTSDDNFSDSEDKPFIG